MAVQASVTAGTQPKRRGLHRIRWIADGEPELQCARCFEFLPITTEFWAPEHGVRTCRVCQSERNVARARRRRHLVNRREYRRNYCREWARRNRSTLARYMQDVA